VIITPDHGEAGPALFWRRLLRPGIVERGMIFADLVLIVLCGLGSGIAYHWYAGAEFQPSSIDAAVSVLVAVNFVLLVTVQRGYEIKAMEHPLRQTRIAMVTWTGAIAFAMKISDSFSRGATISFFAAGELLICGWKGGAAVLISQARQTGAFTNHRVVVIAEHGLAAASSSLAELCRHGYRLARILEISSAELSSPLLMSSVNEPVMEVVAYARENGIEDVFLLISWNKQHAIDSILDALKVLPLPVHLLPDPALARFLRYPISQDNGTWTTELRRAPLSRDELRLKRSFDLLGATLALVVFAPIMVAAAILVACDSRGPILFRQTRNGFNGKAFRIFKFRSMTVTEDGPRIVQATAHDIRVTGIGRWLRRTSIDELPQLFNVLSGEMSLVGPRPHAAAHNCEYEKVIGNYAFRHHVKPGITGWAQVNGCRGETREVGLMEKRVEYDLWYINNWSVWLDVRILIETAMLGFRPGHTAY
jgi:undecaprenyl-phosphate galactose phosphotransferase/putative colanic acid biosynthesis UDP-glucose lipid carrier transferase